MQRPFAPGRPSYSVVWPRRPATIPQPLRQHGPVACAEVANFSYAEIVVAYFPDAVVTRTGAVIVQDKYIVQETLEGWPQANGISEKLTAADLAACPRSDEIIINCNRLGMWNYSIFLLEVAPTIMLASLTPGLEPYRLKVFFPKFVQGAHLENRMKIFSLFGIAPERMLHATLDFCRHRGVILFKINDSHKSQRLSQILTPSCAMLAAAFSGPAESPRRLYVSRQHAASRKISNYAALHDRVLAAHGIVPVMLENMQIEQQVDLFAKADLVIAEHGAGLANVAFMRPGATLIELLPRPIAHRAVYRYVAAHRHLNYIYATLPVPEGWRWDKDDLFAPLDLYDFLLSEESAMPRQHIAAA
jgi:hypothetical protein